MTKTLSKILSTLEGKEIDEMFLYLKNQLALDNDNIKKIINLKTGIQITTFEDLVFEPHSVGEGTMSYGKIRGKKYSIVSGERFYSDGEGLNYEVYNEDMDEPDGYLDEDEVTLTLLNLLK
mgnify:FL=1